MLSAKLQTAEKNVIRQLHSLAHKISDPYERNMAIDLISRRSMLHRVCYMQFDPNWVIDSRKSECIMHAMVKMSRLKVAYNYCTFKDPAAKVLGARIDYICNVLRSGLIIHACKNAPMHEIERATWLSIDFSSLSIMADDINGTLWSVATSIPRN